MEPNLLPFICKHNFLFDFPIKKLKSELNYFTTGPQTKEDNATVSDI